MIVKIEIDCESITDLYTHLRVIQAEIKKRVKKQKLDPFNDEFPPTEWQDDNCYGSHTVTIMEDEMLKDHLPPSIFP